MFKVQEKILLCKGLSNENDTQKSYKTVLEAAGYICQFLPALRFEFINLKKLQECLLKHDTFSGLILTSRRSVEAINAAINEDFVNMKSWKTMPAYCVGPATASLAKECLQLTNCLGGELGNSKELAEFITKNSQENRMPLLYPCSEIAKDTIERILTNNNVKVKKLVVYRTLTSETLETDFIKAMEILPRVIVFFSPSVVDCVTPLLRKKQNVLKNIKMITIGPITGEALVKAKFEVDRISETPEPSALLRAVKSCIEHN